MKEKKSYDLDDAIAAQYTLEPMKCRKCKEIGYTTYHKYVDDAKCAKCGAWQSEYTKKGERRKRLRS